MIDWLRQLFQRPTEQTAWQASAYLWDNKIIVHPNNRTYNNFGWNSQPVSVAEYHSKSTVIAELVLEKIGQCRWDATELDALDKENPILKAVGLRSWRKLEREALLILFERSDSGFTIIPTRRATRGEGIGWVHQDTMIELPVDFTVDDLAQQIDKAFAFCQ